MAWIFENVLYRGRVLTIYRNEGLLFYQQAFIFIQAESFFRDDYS